MDGPQKWIFLVALFIGPALAQDEDGNNNITFHQDPGPVLNRMPCKNETDCQNVEGAYCDQGTHLCTCKPDFMVTDTHNCYRESNYEEFCRMDIQCQRTDENMRCNLDLNLCQCQPRFEAKAVPSGGGRKSKSKCVESENKMDSTGAYYDPALFGIMGGLALMFIVICVVLQMFAKAQFRENRTIFNTPNPRLMNVSLMKDSKLFGATPRKTSGGSLTAAQKRKLRKESVAAAAAAAAAYQIGQTTLETMAEQADPHSLAQASTTQGDLVMDDLDVAGEQTALLLEESPVQPPEAKDRKSSGNAGHNFDDLGGPREPREPRESRESRKRGAGPAVASTSAGAAGSSNLGKVAEEERIQIESET
ncbi:uncharacterized protein LOC131881601 isoform X1 [Tigriopus californicus]|uniref:uncharacterized protein LOC131881601 isoform X1 n=1 Tax=Tigriopus californicus TaxID=6832 RepID=UPI0027D9EC7A|nr:uncharacterized protein LOC131881601 isoform X1 [Tigriopus californicus]